MYQNKRSFNKRENRKEWERRWRKIIRNKIETEDMLFPIEKDYPDSAQQNG